MDEQRKLISKVKTDQIPNTKITDSEQIIKTVKIKFNRQ